jgi:hypothetical protein
MKNQYSVMAQSSKKPKQEKPYTPTNKERSKIYSQQVPQEKRLAREENAKSKTLAKQAKKQNSDFLKSESEYYKKQSEGYKQNAKSLDSTAKSIKRQK